jgi:hypothetical protein
MDKKTERLVHLVKQTQIDYGDKYYIYALPGFLAKNFITYCAMNEDLELILKYINELVKGEHSNVIKSSLTYALISLYGKCFTDASKYKSPKLEAKDLFKTHDDFLKTHEQMMKMRHEFIAHRGDTENEVAISYMLMAKGGEREQDQIKFKRLKQINFSGDDLLKIQKLAEFVLGQLKPKIKKSGEKIHTALFEMFTPEQITKMLMNNAK